MPKRKVWPHPYRSIELTKDASVGTRFSRGYLPHYNPNAAIQMITYRLADSLPKQVLEKLASEADQPGADARRREAIENYLDCGHGACWLRRAEIATVVRDAWLHCDTEQYLLHAWVIMPNHVHVIVEPSPEQALHRIVQAWKSVSARKINRILGRTGTVWQREYWDRYIRGPKHYKSAVDYVYTNPVKAGLVSEIGAWAWSSWKDQIGE